MQISDVYVQSGAADIVKRGSFGDSVANTKKETHKISTNAPANAENASAKVSISGTSAKSGSAEALVEARAKALPEIREERISLAKERIQSGYYNTPEFSQELSSRLVSQGFSNNLIEG